MYKQLIYSFIQFLCVIILQSCKQGSESVSGNTLSSNYQEKHRLQFHFSPDSMWMNDPNGMFYYNGEYHLFYQYYPDSNVWGPMHWGHTISNDMVHWKHLPISLYPDSLGWIFSGSAIVDRENRSELGKVDVPPFLAFFTHHNDVLEKKGADTFQTQSLAYSMDGGRSFEKYLLNPIVRNPGIRDFRDPKVIYHKASGYWVMVLAAYDKVMFYNSPDLKNWEYLSSFGINGDKRLWECPDLVEMPVDNEPVKTRWVLIVSMQQQAPNGGTGTSYFVGDFDGKNFHPDKSGQQWMDYGTDNYAFVTWSGVEDGRTLGIGWMSNWQYAQVVPTQRWRSAMTLPRELRLIKNKTGYKLISMPVFELNVLEKSEKILAANKIITDETEYSVPHLSRITLKCPKPESGKISIRFFNNDGEYLDIGYDSNLKKYFIDRGKAGDASFYKDFAAIHYGLTDYTHDEISMDIYLDVASVELFADGGKCVMTDIFFPSSPYRKMKVRTENTNVKLTQLAATELKSIWK